MDPSHDAEPIEARLEDGVDVWAKTLMEYWVPGLEPMKTVAVQLGIVRSAISPETPMSEAFGVLEGSVKAVQDFLALPLTLSRALMDALGTPNHMSGVRDFRLRVTAEVMGQEIIQPQLNRVKQQALVLLWGAYETFARDVFVLTLNEAPTLFARLLKTPLKDRFQSQQVFSLSGLERYDFSLKGRLGEAVADGKDFSSPALLRVLFEHLFAGEQQQDLVVRHCHSPALWLLGHRRHVIAHRAGRVDQEYVDSTGDTAQRIGASLVVRPGEVERAIHAIAAAAISVALVAVGAIGAASLDRPTET